MVAFECGLTETLDPLAWSCAVEALTDELEHQVGQMIEDIEKRGEAFAVH